MNAAVPANAAAPVARIFLRLNSVMFVSCIVLLVVFGRTFVAHVDPAQQDSFGVVFCMPKATL